MNLINEVDSHTSLAELKNENEKTKIVLERIKGERDKFLNEITKLKELEVNF